MRPPLLLLPGMLSDAAFWRAQTAALADLCTPLVMSYGLADSIGAMADHVLGEAPDTFALAGHSMGGRVALEVVRRAPDRVTHLGLLCTDCRGHESTATRDDEAANSERLLAHARQHGMGSLARLWFTGLIAPAQAENHDLVDERVAMGARHTQEQLVAETQAGLTRQEQSHVLNTITCPTLVVAGELDRLRPAGSHARMAGRTPNARFVVVARSGHMLAMEQPDALTAVMKDWLQTIERTNS